MDSKYISRIRECFPGLVIDSVEWNQDGLVNDVLVINGELVFRFPKNNTWARALLENELKVLGLVRKHLDIQIPAVEYQADYFVVYRFLNGSPLQRNDILILEEEAQDRIADQLATYLLQMHAIPMDEIERHGISQSDVNRGHQVWVRLFEDVERELFPIMMPHASDWVKDHFKPVLEDENWMNYQPCLINGDIGPYHLLFDKAANRISGAIDFGTAGIGDPAADFACIIYNYGESFLKRMTKYYPRIEDAVDRARFWSGTLELQWALSGLRGRASRWSWFTVHLGSARDVMPIGSKWSNE